MHTIHINLVSFIWRRQNDCQLTGWVIMLKVVIINGD